MISRCSTEGFLGHWCTAVPVLVGRNPLLPLFSSLFDQQFDQLSLFLSKYMGRLYKGGSMILNWVKKTMTNLLLRVGTKSQLVTEVQNVSFCMNKILWKQKLNYRKKYLKETWLLIMHKGTFGWQVVLVHITCFQNKLHVCFTHHVTADFVEILSSPA